MLTGKLSKLSMSVYICSYLTTTCLQLHVYQNRMLCVLCGVYVNTKIDQSGLFSSQVLVYILSVRTVVLLAICGIVRPSTYMCK